MSRSNADLLALKAELQNDPLDLGLTVLAADDEANANALNLVRATILIDRESIPVSEVVKAIDRDEFNAASAADRQYLGMITAGGDVNPKTGGEVREAILQIFGTLTETRANLLAILQEPANRIDALYKAGTLQAGGTVTPSDIANARVAT
jgi:hypothetical protein